MIRFKTFEDVDGRTIAINPQLVEAFTDSGTPIDTGRIITISKSEFLVKGTLVEVAGKLSIAYP
jgi:hypothetical protein